jgi:hypothetical protein
MSRRQQRDDCVITVIVPIQVTSTSTTVVRYGGPLVDMAYALAGVPPLSL